MAQSSPCRPGIIHARLSAAALAEASAIGAVHATGAPLRLAFFQFATAPTRPMVADRQGSDFRSTRRWRPLNPIKDKIQVLGRPRARAAPSGPDGAGDHGSRGWLLPDWRARQENARRGFPLRHFRWTKFIAQQVGHVTRLSRLRFSFSAIRSAPPALRQRLRLRLPAQHGVGLAHFAHRTRDQSPPAVRAPFRLRFARGAQAKSRRSANASSALILDYVNNEARGHRPRALRCPWAGSPLRRAFVPRPTEARPISDQRARD